MITKNIEGIIFNHFDCKDNDLILDVFTKELGYVKLYVKGAKKITNKSFYVYTLYNKINFDLKRSDINGLSIPQNSSVIKTFDFTKLSLEKINMLSLVSELLLKIKEVYEHSDESYYHLLDALIISLLNKESNSLDYINYFIFYSLAYLGVQPILNKCASCGSQQDIIAFSFYEHGFVCRNCIGNKVLKEQDILLYLFALQKQDYTKMNELKQCSKRGYQILYEYLYNNGGIYLISNTYIGGN